MSAEIESSDEIVAEEVARAAFFAVISRPVPPGREAAAQHTALLEETFLGGRAAAKVWRADQAAARMAGVRAVVRYAHELRGTR